MKAVILAAGEGRRLQPLTENMPKVMLPVANRPILSYVVDALVRNDVREIIMVVGYHAEKIKQYFGNGRRFSANISYVKQEKQLGTAHALYQARTDGDFMVLPGDNIISDECIKKMRNSEENTISGVYTAHFSKYGIIEKEGGNAKIIENPGEEGNNLVFTGITHLNESVFDIIESALKSGIYDLPSVLNWMGGLNVRVGNCDWMDAVYPWDLLELNSWALKGLSRSLSGKIEDATILGDVEIGAGTTIGNGTYIKGPVRIGKNCHIGQNSVILPDTTIGDDVSIGPLSFVKNSIIMSSNTIGQRMNIEDTVIGRGNEIGTEFICLSSRWKRIIEDEIVRRDAGPVIGDDCTIGPKITVFPGVRVASGAHMKGMRAVEDDVTSGDVM